MLLLGANEVLALGKSNALRLYTSSNVGDYETQFDIVGAVCVNV